MKSRIVTRSTGILLVSAILAALASCAGSENGAADDGDDFKTLLGRIVQDASDQYGALAERVRSINDNDPLPDDFKAQMREVAATARRAADGVEALSAPQAAAEMVRALVAGLRARADAFERAAARPGVTLQELEREGSLTAAGEVLDAALGQLREAGFLPKEEPHD